MKNKILVFFFLCPLFLAAQTDLVPLWKQEAAAADTANYVSAFRLADSISKISAKEQQTQHHVLALVRAWRWRIDAHYSSLRNKPNKLDIGTTDSLNFARLEKEINKSASPEKEMLVLFKMHKLRLANERNQARMEWIDAQDSLAKPTNCVYTWGTKRYKEELMKCYAYLYERLDALEKFNTEKYLLWYNKLIVAGSDYVESMSEAVFVNELQDFTRHHPTFRDWMMFSLEEELKKDDFPIANKFILYSSPDLLQKASNSPPSANNCAYFWRYLHQQRLQYYLQIHDYAAAIEGEMQRLEVEKERIGNDTLFEKALRNSFVYFRTLAHPADKNTSHSKACVKMADYLMELYCEKYDENPKKYIALIEPLVKYAKELSFAKKNENESVRQIAKRWKYLCFPRHELENNTSATAFLPNILSVSYQNNPTLAVYVLKKDKKYDKKTIEIYLKRHIQKHKKDAFTQIEDIAPFANKNTPAFWKMQLRLPDSCQDHRNHTGTIVLPPLSPGDYLIVVADSGLWHQDKPYSYQDYTVLNLTSENIQTESQAKFYFRENITGKASPFLPIKVTINQFDNGRRTTSSISKHISDAKGGLALNLENKDEQINLSSTDEKQPFQTQIRQNMPGIIGYEQFTVDIFTDRSIYRPKQEVFFKGIASRIAAKEVGNAQYVGKTILLKNKKISVQLNNAFGQTIETKEFTTNEYGSFNGSFMLPEDIALGRTSLYIIDSNNKHSFEVAEYRRPQMEMVLDKNDISYLYTGDTLRLTGRTFSMNALPLQGVSVNARFIVSRHKKIEPKLCPKYQEESRYSDGTHARDSYSEDVEGCGIPDLFDEDPTYDRWGMPSNYVLQANDSILSTQNFTTKNDGSFDFDFVLPNIDFDLLESQTLRVVLTATDAGESVERMATYSLSSDSTHNSKEKYIHLYPSEEGTYKHRLTHLATVSYKNTGDFTVFVEKMKVPENPILFRDVEGESQISEKDFRRLYPYHAYTKADNPYDYPVQSLVFKEKIVGKGEGIYKVAMPKNLPQGYYRVRIVPTDKKLNTDKISLVIKDTLAKEYAIPVVLEDVVHTSNLEVGQTLQHTLYTSLDSLWLHYVIAFDGVEYKHLTQKEPLHFIQDTLILLRKGRNIFSYPITATYSQHFVIHLSAVFHGKEIQAERYIWVRNPQNEIKFQWITFRNLLSPGQKETWKLKINGPNNEKVSAEVLAGMYDGSLDQLNPFSAPFTHFEAEMSDIYLRQERSIVSRIYKSGMHGFSPSFSSASWEGSPWYNRWNGDFSSYIILKKKKHHRRLYGEDSMWWTNPLMGMNGSLADTRKLVKQVSEDADSDGIPDLFDQEPDTAEGEVVDSKGRTLDSDNDGVPDSVDEELNTPLGNDVDNHGVTVKQAAAGKLEKSNVEEGEKLHIRKKLQETAFFYPNLVTDANGVVTISFESPEALTKWHFYALAHTQDMRTCATDTMRIYTRKQLSIVAAFPRFLYEKDEANLTAKIINSSEKTVQATCKIQFFEGENDVTNKILSQSIQNVTLNSRQSQNVYWKVVIPMGYRALRYQVIVESEEWSDGEENILPILSIKKEVTESFPIFAHRNENRTFSLAKWNEQLPASAELKSLTLTYNPEPLYNVLMALPYLMEFPHECSEQMMSRYYANSLASYLLSQHPEMAQVLQSYRPAVKNPAFLNQKEQQDRQYWDNIRKLMDSQRIAAENKRIIEKLKKRGTSEGLLSWFDGMRGDVYISRHVATLIADLQNKGIPVEKELLEIKDNAVRYLDRDFTRYYKDAYKDIKKESDIVKKNHLYSGVIEYLYLRTLDTAEFRRSKQEKAFEFWIQQAATFGLTRSIDEQAILAWVLFKNDKTQAAKAMLDIWKAKAEPIHPEYGTTWKIRTEYEDYEVSITTHAHWLRAFRECSKDTAFSEALQQWLIAQKQGSAWESTMATTAACEALMASAYKGVSDKTPIKINILNNVYIPEKEKGLYEMSIPIPEKMPENIVIHTTLAAPAYSYGALSRTYSAEYQDFKANGSKTTIQKTLYVEQSDGTWKKLDGIVKKGAKVKVRLLITNELEMEYVHIEDRRAAGLESIQVLSGYNCGDNLCYYQSIKDAGTHFFIDNLSKGTHIIEYELRSTHLGNFNAAISEIECMYTPLLRAHTKGEKLEVRE